MPSPVQLRKPKGTDVPHMVRLMKPRIRGERLLSAILDEARRMGSTAPSC